MSIRPKLGSLGIKRITSFGLGKINLLLRNVLCHQIKKAAMMTLGIAHGKILTFKMVSV